MQERVVKFLEKKSPLPYKFSQYPAALTKSLCIINKQQVLDQKMSLEQAQREQRRTSLQATDTSALGARNSAVVPGLLNGAPD